MKINKKIVCYRKCKQKIEINYLMKINKKNSNVTENASKKLK